MLTGIPFRLMDYIELVDWTGREFRGGKARIRTQLPPILQRLSISQREWLKACTQLERQRALLIGSKPSLYAAIPKMQRQRQRGFQFG
jgi:hypothetical protein